MSEDRLAVHEKLHFNPHRGRTRLRGRSTNRRGGRVESRRTGDASRGCRVERSAQRRGEAEEQALTSSPRSRSRHVTPATRAARGVRRHAECALGQLWQGVHGSSSWLMRRRALRGAGAVNVVVSDLDRVPAGNVAGVTGPRPRAGCGSRGCWTSCCCRCC